MRNFDPFNANADCYSNVCGHRALYVLGASLSLTVITGLMFAAFL